MSLSCTGAPRHDGSCLVPIIIGVDHEGERVNAVAMGTVTFADIQSHLLAESHFGGLAFKELVDGRAASFVWTPEEVLEVVEIVRNLSLKTKFGPTAVLVSSDASFGMILMLELALEGIAEVRPFRSEQEARSWLAERLPFD
jgi:hypothetical protein